jgi:LacI family transcriptional regulator
MARVSIADVAREAGTSSGTVSKVLNDGPESDRIGEDCRRRVLKACDSLGYVRNHAARSLRTGRSFAIGGLLSSPRSGSRGERGAEDIQFYAPFQAGMLEAATRHGLQLIALAGNEDASPAEVAVSQLRRGRIDGLVVHSVQWRRSAPVVRELWPEWPVVVAPAPAGLDIPHVGVDDLAGVVEGLQYLYGLGHRAIAWVGPGDAEAESYPALRQEKYVEWMNSRGLQPTVLHANSPIDMAGQPLGGRAMALAEPLADGLSEEYPTAVLAYNDEWAMGVYAACARLGLRVPQDLSVVGFDDVHAAAAMPALTTLSLGLYRVGERAVERLVRMVEGKPDASDGRNVPARLVVRDSTASCPRSTNQEPEKGPQGKLQ